MTDGPLDIRLPHHPVEPRTRLDAEFLGARAQQRLKLRIALQLAGHLLHAPFDLAARLGMVSATQALLLRLKPVPHLDQALGFQVRVLPHPVLVLDAGDELRGTQTVGMEESRFPGKTSVRGWTRSLGAKGGTVEVAREDDDPADEEASAKVAKKHPAPKRKK